MIAHLLELVHSHEKLTAKFPIISSFATDCPLASYSYVQTPLGSSIVATSNH